jgi:hypothetical protein
MTSRFESILKHYEAKIGERFEINCGPKIVDPAETIFGSPTKVGLKFEIKMLKYSFTL